MTIATSLLAEFEQQAPVTRKYLERLPEARYAWKPHVKSLTAGQLAYHLAIIPGGVIRAVQHDTMPPPEFKFPAPADAGQVLDTMDSSIAAVRDLLPGLSDERMRATFRMSIDGRDLLAQPRADFLRNIMLNHWYQHRGQFSVYLRMMDIPVPSSWGPSADDPGPLGSAR